MRLVVAQCAAVGSIYFAVLVDLTQFQECEVQKCAVMTRRLAVIIGRSAGASDAVSSSLFKSSSTAANASLVSRRNRL